MGRRRGGGGAAAAACWALSVAAAVAAPVGGRSRGAASWYEAEARARQVLQRLTTAEVLQLLAGEDPRVYTGQIPAFTERGVFALNMQNGPQGVQTVYRQFQAPGTSTAWPCALAMAATFDSAQVAAWGGAMAREFVAKGANVWLGPGLNVLRVPFNGRSFEYLSGEDPLLGAELVAALIPAVQAEGVAATAKHFLGNSQETERGSVNERVDERTLRELYLPPFEAAVGADTAAVMCSYNRINGSWACGSNSTLTRVLREDWGFRGWVMSDWGATHSTEALASGLDQEMPFGQFFTPSNITKSIREGHISEADANRAAERVLTGAFFAAAPPSGNLKANVTSDEHAAIARDLAGASAILLQNNVPATHADSGEAHCVLPLQKGLKVAVVGDAAHKKPIVTGGGSGHVDPAWVSTHFSALAAQTDATYADSSDPVAAAALAAQSDVAVVVVGVESREGQDRRSLSLAEADDSLVRAVAAANPKTVVVVCAPGPVLLPWREDVPAILFTLYGGQEAGAGVADVLLGDRAPSGRLPFTIPAEEPMFPPSAFPGEGGEAVYLERLRIGYRAYRPLGSEEGAHGGEGILEGLAGREPAFWFGFGMSYTEFEYSGLHFDEDTVQVNVANVGSVTSVDVPQLYLSFPAGEEEPERQLRRFRALRLQPGESQEVSWTLGKRDFSVWDEGVGGWRLVLGKFQLYVCPDAGCTGCSDPSAELEVREGFALRPPGRAAGAP